MASMQTQFMQQALTGSKLSPVLVPSLAPYAEDEGRREAAQRLATNNRSVIS